MNSLSPVLTTACLPAWAIPVLWTLRWGVVSTLVTSPRMWLGHCDSGVAAGDFSHFPFCAEQGEGTVRGQCCPQPMTSWL